MKEQRQAQRVKPPPPLDTGWAWMIVLGVFVNAFFMVGIAKSFGLFLDEFKRKFEVTTAAAAMTMSVCSFVYAFLAPTALILGERFTPQKVVLAGAVVAFIGMSLSSLTFSMTFVVVTFGLCYGVGNSCVYGNGLLMIGKYFRKRRSLATGIALAGASIGQFILPPTIEFFLENYGLGGTLLIISALYFNSAVAGSLFRPIEQYGPEKGAEVLIVAEEEKLNGGSPCVEDQVTAASFHSSKDLAEDKDKVTPNGTNSELSPLHTEDLNKNKEESAKRIQSGADGSVDDAETRQELAKKAVHASSGSLFAAGASLPDVSRIDDDDEPHEVETAVKKSPSGITRVLDFTVLKSYITLFYTVLSFFCFFGYFNFILFLPSILREKGILKYDKAMLISFCGIGDLIARIGVGFVADFNFIPRYKIKALACILCAMNMFVFIYADTFPWLGVHCFLYGLLGGSYVCLLAVVLVDFVGLETMAKNLAVVLLIQGVGGAIGQPVLGAVRDETNSYDMVILVCALSQGLGGIILFFYPMVKKLEDKRRNQKAGWSLTEKVKEKMTQPYIR